MNFIFAGPLPWQPCYRATTKNDDYNNFTRKTGRIVSKMRDCDLRIETKEVAQCKYTQDASSEFF